MRVAIIGGGAAGLSAAYHLGKFGMNAFVFEAERLLGGLASWFEIGGQNLEKYYHFLCLHDHEYLQTCEELGLSGFVRWRPVKMGYFYNGKLFSFGDPWDLFVFPYLTWKEKVRFALAIQRIKSAKSSDWDAIADRPVVPWLIETFGEKVFKIIHAPLVSGKFGEYKDKLSAAWMWARIHRVGTSRSRFLNKEIYGYLEGGSFRLMESLVERIRRQGGQVMTQAPITEIRCKDGRVEGLVVHGEFKPFDAIISTIPFQLLRRMLSDANDPYFHQLDHAEYYGVTCLVLRVKRRLTPHYWLNICDPAIEVPGLIEYTNLNPLPFLKGDHLLYMPQYLDPSDKRFALDIHGLMKKFIPYLKKIDSQFNEDQIIEAHAFHNTHAQPLCDLGFHKRIPSKRTTIRGLYATDSYQLHPDDRTVSFSLGMGRDAANVLREDLLADIH